MKKNKLHKFGSSDYLKLDNQMRAIFIKVVNQDLSQLLSKINCYTLLVWDKKDKVTPYWICNKLFRLIKQSKKIILQNGGHFACFYNVIKFVNIVEQMSVSTCFMTQTINTKT